MKIRIGIGPVAWDMRQIAAGALPFDIAAAFGVLALGFRAVGVGSVSVVTAAGNVRTVLVENGEIVRCKISMVSAAVGVTGVRIHLPRWAR